MVSKNENEIAGERHAEEIRLRVERDDLLVFSGLAAHSFRSATAGSIDAARRAGMNPAIDEEKTKVNTAVVNNAASSPVTS